MVAMEATAMGPEFDLVAGNNMRAKFSSGTLSFEATCTKKKEVINELQQVIGNYTTRSNEFKNFILYGTVQDNGTVKFTISSADDGAKVLGYSDFERHLTKN